MVTSKLIETPYNTLTYKIIGCAMAVHRELGPGLREDTYQRSLANYFVERSISFKEEKLYPVTDDADHERLVGHYIPDFVVEKKVIVEIKAVQASDKSHLPSYRIPGCICTSYWIASKLRQTQPELSPRVSATKSD